MRFEKLQIMTLSAFVIFLIAISQTASGAFCPEGAYVGRDNQGNTICRDIISNEIINSETIAADSGRGTVSDSGRAIITDSRITNSDNEIIQNDNQTDYTIFGILGIVGVIGAVIIAYGKKILPNIAGKRIVSGIPQILSWSNIQKEEVRKRQYQMCNICYTKPSKWAYDHIDGNKKNNNVNNCQGLCQKCKSEKSMIKKLI